VAPKRDADSVGCRARERDDEAQRAINHVVVGGDGRDRPHLTCRTDERCDARCYGKVDRLLRAEMRDDRYRLFQLDQSGQSGGLDEATEPGRRRTDDELAARPSKALRAVGNDPQPRGVDEGEPGEIDDDGTMALSDYGVKERSQIRSAEEVYFAPYANYCPRSLATDRDGKSPLRHVDRRHGNLTSATRPTHRRPGTAAAR